MSNTAIVTVGVIVAVIVLGAVLTYGMRHRSNELRDRFGSEYDRTVERSGDRREAERELRGRVARRNTLSIVRLDAQKRERYLRRWNQVQADFVDAPVESVRAADVLVGQVMTDRGYPVADFEQRAADISVDHANVVDNYREAHDISERTHDDRATTEDLRQAMRRYRSLFDELLAEEAVPAGQTAALTQLSR